MGAEFTGGGGLTDNWRCRGEGRTLEPKGRPEVQGRREDTGAEGKTGVAGERGET